MKKPKNMVVGQKYRGYGLLNEFGEFEFVPEMTGSHTGRVNEFKRGDGYTVKTSRDFIFFYLKIKRKGTTLQRISDLMNHIDLIINILRDYEF